MAGRIESREACAGVGGVCSPHAVGDADVDAEVLLAVKVVLADSEDVLAVTDS